MILETKLNHIQIMWNNIIEDEMMDRRKSEDEKRRETLIWIPFWLGFFY